VAREIAAGGAALRELRACAEDPGFDAVAAWRALVPDPEVRAPHERFEAALREMAGLLAARGIDFVLVKEAYCGGTNPWREAFYAAIDRVAGECGARVVDPGPAIAAAGGKALFMDQVHLLPAGHAVMARQLLPVVESLLARREAGGR
jgi:hypothetical protein